MEEALHAHIARRVACAFRSSLFTGCWMHGAYGYGRRAQSPYVAGTRMVLQAVACER